jgi:uncharacterized protein YjbJ (UPF0337 family)
MDRVNRVVPDSMAATTKIARNRNARGNSASAKNKAVAGNRVAAISKEAPTRRTIGLVFSKYSDGGGYSRRLFVRVPTAFSSNHITTTAFIPRDFVLMKSSTKDKIKGGFEEAKGKVKEKAGKATGNPELRDRGTAEKAGGKVQRKIGDLKKVFEQ